MPRNVFAVIRSCRVAANDTVSKHSASTIQVLSGKFIGGTSLSHENLTRSNANRARLSLPRIFAMLLLPGTAIFSRGMPRLTLNRVFVLSLVGLLAGITALFLVLFSGLQTALLKSAAQAEDNDSAVIARNVSDYLDQAPNAAKNFESLLSAGLTSSPGMQSLRDGLLTVLLENPNISEATFTFAQTRGFDARGHVIVDAPSVGQVSLFRARKAAGFVHLTTWYDTGRFLSTRTHIFLDGRETVPSVPAPAGDPAANDTFTTPSAKNFYGQLLWTDLHWSWLDEALPQKQRRIEVSVLKAIEYPAGHFIGVLRIGLFKTEIDKAIDMPSAVDTHTHSIFLCDSDGRLIAISGTSGYVTSGDDIRRSAAGAPHQVIAALQLPVLRKEMPDSPPATDQFAISGTTFLCTFRSLPATQSWIVGMVVPQNVYLKGLLRIRKRAGLGASLLVVLIAVFGMLVLHGVSRAHSIIVREAARMNDFLLDPSTHSSRLQDINRVLASLERAKTAMRSMGKYAPLDLVRRLYHRGEEPSLGGEATELSVLFTDIQSFTEFAERVDGDTVAMRLGSYLHVLANVIQREKGTIDKFIGDSVMAFWNAPEPVPGHAALACRAALAGREALSALYASPEWKEVPGFQTRFGIHHCVASVGHFGSPERFNYTAIGDGINLASRLQSLNKQYGTWIIVSQALRDAAGSDFLFRHLDRVAVKGKSQSLDVYELVGCSDASPRPAHISVYEQALEAYFQADFQRALALVEVLGMGSPQRTPRLPLPRLSRQPAHGILDRDFHLRVKIEIKLARWEYAPGCFL